MEEERNFGQFFRELRRRKGISLRQFCIEGGFDPGNLSKIERGRLQPPQSEKILKAYANALGVPEGSEDWHTFLDLAHIAAGRIPAALLSDQEVAARLPLVFRTLRRRQVNQDDLDALIELLRKE